LEFNPNWTKKLGGFLSKGGASLISYALEKLKKEKTSSTKLGHDYVFITFIGERSQNLSKVQYL
jgi:hypothetical protein